MAGWVVPDVLTFMPPDLKAAYLLLSQAVREAELAALLASAVSDFRLAFNAASDPVGALDETTVPDTVMQRVRVLVWYPLALELGVDTSELRTPWQDAEIYLRQMLRERNEVGGVSAVVGTPHYSSGPAQGFVRLSGTPAVSPPAPPIQYETINYSTASSTMV